MKKLFVLVAILSLFIALCGCTQSNQNLNQGSGLMAIDKNIKDLNKSSTDKNTNVFNNLNDYKIVKSGDVVKVDYTGRLTDGNIFDSSIGREPLEFTVGAGQMIKGFDSGVVGMKVGETKTITLTPADAYGPIDPKRIVSIDKNQFADFDSLEKGLSVSGANGMRGLIIEKNDENAVIDFNHELAGKTLVFEIKLVSIN